MTNLIILNLTIWTVGNIQSFCFVTAGGVLACPSVCMHGAFWLRETDWVMEGMKNVFLTLFCKQGLSPVVGDEDSNPVSCFSGKTLWAPSRHYTAVLFRWRNKVCGWKGRFFAPLAESESQSVAFRNRRQERPWHGLGIFTEAFSVVTLVEVLEGKRKTEQMLCGNC